MDNAYNYNIMNFEISGILLTMKHSPDSLSTVILDVSVCLHIETCERSCAVLYQ